MSAISSKRKRSTQGSIFDKVASLEQEDDAMQLHKSRHRHGTTSNNNNKDYDDDDDDDMLLLRRQRQKLAVQAQTNIYSRLMECRILLQRSMTSVVETSTKNDNNEHSFFGTTQTDHAAIGGTADAAIEQCNQILVHLLEARKLLSYHNTTNTTNNNNSNDQDDSMNMDSVNYASLLQDTSSSAATVALEEQLQKEYEMCRHQWKDVLNRRHYEIQLHSGMMTNHKKFNQIDTSFWNSVQATIQHQQLRNHHPNHPNYNNGTTNVNDVSTLSLQPPKYKHYQPLDDTKLYQQMLKDFVETTASTSNNNHNSSSSSSNAAQVLLRKRHSSHLSSSSSSSKAMVDRKASKGRKIRYTTMTKLTNFTFPIPRRNATTTVSSFSSSSNVGAMNTFLDEDAWFRSLFGGQ